MVQIRCWLGTATSVSPFHSEIYKQYKWLIFTVTLGKKWSYRNLDHTSHKISTLSRTRHGSFSFFFDGTASVFKSNGFYSKFPSVFKMDDKQYIIGIFGIRDHTPMALSLLWCRVLLGRCSRVVTIFSGLNHTPDDNVFVVHVSTSSSDRFTTGNPRSCCCQLNAALETTSLGIFRTQHTKSNTSANYRN